MVRFTASGGVGVFLAGVTALAAETPPPWKPPAPTNLQVLPRDIGSRELVDTMRGFTRALGVRCQHCHVYRGENPNDLGMFDFASDEKAAKTTARAMLRMAAAINTVHLSGIVEAGSAGPRVTCYTCHRGETDPPSGPPARP